MTPPLRTFPREALIVEAATRAQDTGDMTGGQAKLDELNNLNLRQIDMMQRVADEYPSFNP